MTLVTRLLVAVVLATSLSARASTILIPDFLDDDPSEGLKTRTTIVKAVGGLPGVTIAPMSKFKKLAKTAHLDPKQLGNGPAAKILCKLGKIDGILGGVVEGADERRHLHLELYDANGRSLFKRDAELSEGELRQDQIDRLAKTLAAALPSGGAGDRKPVKPTDVSNAGTGDEASDDEGLPPEKVREPPPKAKAAEPVPEINEEKEEREQKKREGKPPPDDSDAEPPRERDDSDRRRSRADNDGESEQRRDHDEERAKQIADSNAHLDRFEDPLVQLEVGVAGSTTSAQLYDDVHQDTQSNLSSGFYFGFIARLQSYPFHDSLNLLAGLGAQVIFSYAPISLSTSSGGGFNATDLRFTGLLDYRLRLGFLFSGEAAIFNPSIGLRVGLQVTDLDVPAMNSANLNSLDRLAPLVGGELVWPFGHYLRLILGGQYYFAPYPGQTSNPNSIEAQLGAAQVFSLGFSLDGELQAHIGNPNDSAFTLGFRAGYNQYADCFELANNPNGCSYNETQSSIDFWLLIGYAFY